MSHSLEREICVDALPLDGVQIDADQSNQLSRSSFNTRIDDCFIERDDSFSPLLAALTRAPAIE